MEYKGRIRKSMFKEEVENYRNHTELRVTETYTASAKSAWNFEQKTANGGLFHPCGDYRGFINCVKPFTRYFIFGRLMAGASVQIKCSR